MIGPVVGSICLGIVLGWLTRYFLARFQQFNVKIFSSVVSVICGGVVIRMFPDPYHYAGWFYPVGLLLGILLYPLISWGEHLRAKPASDDAQKPLRRKSPRKKEDG
jgi:hypothetical protein